MSLSKPLMAADGHSQFHIMKLFIITELIAGIKALGQTHSKEILRRISIDSLSISTEKTSTGRRFRILNWPIVHVFGLLESIWRKPMATRGEHANTTQKVLLAQLISNQETSAEVTVTHTRDPLNLTINFLCCVLNTLSLWNNKPQSSLHCFILQW